jgi:hypothetical protein
VRFRSEDEFGIKKLRWLAALQGCLAQGSSTRE